MTLRWGVQVQGIKKLTLPPEKNGPSQKLAKRWTVLSLQWTVTATGENRASKRRLIQGGWQQEIYDTAGPRTGELIKNANHRYITFPQLICSTAVSRKKKYILSLMSKEPTKLGSESRWIWNHGVTGWLLSMYRLEFVNPHHFHDNRNGFSSAICCLSYQTHLTNKYLPLLSPYVNSMFTELLGAKKTR